MSKSKIRVLLADDHNILREGLRALLEQEPDMDVVADVADGHGAIELARELDPDVVVMDISMPGINGIVATRQIKGNRSRTRVLCLSVHRENRLVAAMLEAGSAGYLLKTSARDELVEAVRTVASGGIYLSPPILSDVIEHHVRGRGGEQGAFRELTERELEVVQLIAEGHHTKAIGERLGISPKTVLTHRENVMTKLGVDSIAALTRYALREGIAEL